MELDKILKGKAEDFHFIGERLKEIREELIKNDDVDTKRMSKFSRKNSAERMGVDYATMQNVERGSLSVTTIKLILYYYTLGYNPTWIITPDNEFIPKHNIGENVVYQSEIQKEFKYLEENVLHALTKFKSKL
jgi:transcriptional regulator with XRE-family HTH domain